MKSKNRTILIVVVILLLLALFMGAQQCDNDPTGHIVAVGDGADSDVQARLAPEENRSNSSGRASGSGLPDEEDGYVQSYYQPRAFCGDGECNGRENCASCAEDCACLQGESCIEGACAFVECDSDDDCVDDDPCTPEVCYFAGHANAFCAFEQITERNFNDGCCPEGAWVDTDSDCEPVCGNLHCEYGEHTEDCPVDCKYAGGSSGGGQTGGRTTPN